MADMTSGRAMVARPTSSDPLMAPTDALSRIVRLTLGVTGLAAQAFLDLLARCVPADGVAPGLRTRLRRLDPQGWAARGLAEQRRRHLAVHDLLARSAVIYDWSYRAPRT